MKNYVLSIANQKGGVGKTTTVLNLSAALAVLGKKVLIIDMDPQSNCSTGLGFHSNSKDIFSIYDVLTSKRDINNAIYETVVPNLSIIPANMNLAALEVELVNEPEREKILSMMLSYIKQDFDYIIIDCAPSLGLLTVNALTSADSVFVPMQCEYFSLEGLVHLMNTIKQIQANYNSKLSIRGILLTMYDSRNRVSTLVEREVREHYSNLVYKTTIPRNITLSESTSHGYPTIIYDVKAKGSQAYISLAAEFLTQSKNT